MYTIQYIHHTQYLWTFLFTNNKKCKACTFHFQTYQKKKKFQTIQFYIFNIHNSIFHIHKFSNNICNYVFHRHNFSNNICNSILMDCTFIKHFNGIFLHLSLNLKYFSYLSSLQNYLINQHIEFLKLKFNVKLKSIKLKFQSEEEEKIHMELKSLDLSSFIKKYRSTGFLCSEFLLLHLRYVLLLMGFFFVSRPIY